MITYGPIISGWLAVAFWVIFILIWSYLGYILGCWITQTRPSTIPELFKGLKSRFAQIFEKDKS